MICFVTGAVFGFFLTALSYFIFSSSEDSVTRLENKHTLIIERIQTLESRLDDLIDQFEDSQSDNESGFSDDASDHSHPSRGSERESNASSRASDRLSEPSHPSGHSWGGDVDLDDKVHSDQEHKDPEDTHKPHETGAEVVQTHPLVHDETTETDERVEEQDDLLSL